MDSSYSAAMLSITPRTQGLKSLTSVSSLGSARRWKRRTRSVDGSPGSSGNWYHSFQLLHLMAWICWPAGDTNRTLSRLGVGYWRPSRNGRLFTPSMGRSLGTTSGARRRPRRSRNKVDLDRSFRFGGPAGREPSRASGSRRACECLPPSPSCRTRARVALPRHGRRPSGPLSVHQKTMVLRARPRRSSADE